MNTQSSAIPEAFEAQTAAPAIISPAQRLYWSVRREFWENRWLYRAPLGVAAVFLIGFFLITTHLVATKFVVAEQSNTGVRGRLEDHLLAGPYDLAADLMMALAILTGIFYSAEALHGERHDRSILFWKSMPVSDWNSVLAKACIPLLVLPLLSWIITVGEHWVMFVLNVVALLVKGQSPAMLWAQLPLFRMDLGLFYHLFTMHVLWWAPLYAWLLLVSAWARRATFLWAFVPPLAIGILEKILFNTEHFSHMMAYRFAGDPSVTAATAGTFPFDEHMTHLSPLMFLANPGLWVGLLVAAGFLAIAVQLRRRQGPI